MKTYICPTCGRPQHPGEKCQPGHAEQVHDVYKPRNDISDRWYPR